MFVYQSGLGHDLFRTLRRACFTGMFHDLFVSSGNYDSTIHVQYVSNFKTKPKGFMAVYHGVEAPFLWLSRPRSCTKLSINPHTNQPMFHGMKPVHDMFTICLCISPDLDGNRGTKK
jgi:hypothetical protein